MSCAETIGRAGLTMAITQAADSVVITDLAGNIQYVNPAFTAMTGYSCEEAIGQNPRFLKSGRVPAKIYEELWATIRSGQVWHGDMINRRKDGSFYTEEMRITPVKDINGELVNYIAFKQDVTMRKAAESAQKLLATIVESSEDAILAYKPDGTILAWNHGAEIIFGYSAEEINGKNMSLIVAPERLAGHVRYNEQVLQGNSIIQQVGLGVHKDGKRIHVSVTSCPIRDSAGKVTAISAVVHDISERLESEQRINESEERFRGIFQYAPVGMCVSKPNGTFLQVNEALCKMLGYSEQEMLTKTWLELCHPDDLELSLQKADQLMKGECEYIESEVRNIHRSGEVIWGHLTVSLIKTKQGPPFDCVVHIEDITRRKRAEAILHESENRFRIMADSCPAMMWVSNAEGKIQFINRAYMEFSGATSEQLEQGEWLPMVHPDDAPAYDREFHRCRRERTHFSAIARVQREDGEWRHLGMNADPRLSPIGEYLGHVGITADITDKIMAEQAREFEHSLIRTIQEVSLDGILAVNEKSIIVSNNARFMEVWKITSPDAENLPSNLVGSHDEKLRSAIVARVKDSDTFQKRIQHLYDNPEENDQCEVELKDGRTLERNSTRLRSLKGEYLGRVWFFRDITARRQAEISLQNAKALADKTNRLLLEERSILDGERKMLRALIDNVPDFMYIKDAESKFVLANAHLAHSVGVQSPEELIGKSDFDFFPKEMASIFYKDEQSMIRSGIALNNHEENGIDAAGNISHVLTTKVPIRDSQGVVIGLAGIGHDISSRKKMENALRDAEQKYRGIFDNAIFGVFQSIPEGRFLSVNNAMAFTFGYDSPEDMVTTITDISQQLYADPKRRQEFVILMDKVGAVTNFDCEVLRKDGTRLWMAMSVRAIRENGRVIRYEGMCEEITERILLRQQLFQAQKLESVGQLAAGIAHEINTPIQYIGDNTRFLQDAFGDLKILLTSYEHLLSEAKGNTLSSTTIQETNEAVDHADVGYLLDEIPKAIDQALEGVSRVSRLVSAMKEFSHPGTKEKVPLDLNHAIDSTITVARNEWKYVAELETDFDPSLPLVSCLPGEFNQVILNLIVNAAHAIADTIPKGSSAKGMIKVQTHNFLERVEIRVQDSGSGIPEKIQSRIFDPFFTTKEIGKGTGQGLAIARSVIVDKHSGSIHFETEEGKGTTFIIRLPHDGKTPVTQAVAA